MSSISRMSIWFLDHNFQNTVNIAVMLRVSGEITGMSNGLHWVSVNSHPKLHFGGHVQKGEKIPTANHI